MARRTFSAPFSRPSPPGLRIVADASPIKLARHPDYHAGRITFSYLGDIWIANEDGSGVRRLTDNRAREIYPRFSPDGRWIAFSSNRYGNNDVFVVPAEGGAPQRLTFHSGNDEVVGWSRDSKQVIFRAARGVGAFPNVATLHTIAVDGGQEQPLPVDWGFSGSFSPDGKSLVFNRHPVDLVAAALSRQLRGRSLGDESRRQDLHAAAGRRALQPLLADVGRGRRDLLRGRSAAEREDRQAGQPRGARERQQHLQDAGEGRPAGAGDEARRRQPVLAVDVERRQGHRLRRQLRDLEARRRDRQDQRNQDRASPPTRRRTRSNS